jgi:hypothetical protein
MKILVISGFLGAGKTTFISTLSKKCKKDFVVMENEYGDIGLDGSILKEDRLKVWELTEGCICCSLKSDFASSILTIANTLSPDFLVVEPTGVGLLSSVMNNISKIEYEKIQLLEAITIVDVHCVKDYLNKFKDIYIDQLKNAHLIILSKIEDATSKEINDTVCILKEINPKAILLDESYQKQNDKWWENIFENLKPHDASPTNTSFNENHVPDLESISFSDIHFENVNTLLEFLVAILRGYFGNIYRVKGFALIGNAWTKFDVVDKRYVVTLCQNIQKTNAVFIGEKLKKKKLKEALNQHPQS